MGALIASPGVAWPWLGLASAGLAAAVVLAHRTTLPVWWAALAAAPLGVVLYGLGVVFTFAVVPPWAAAGTAAVASFAAALFVLRRWDWRVGFRRGAWMWVLALYAVAGVVAQAGARYARAVIYAVPRDPLLGEPSTGDWGLHVLRAAMIGQHGVPPPSPLDPDYPLQYRYLFHALAAAFCSLSGTDVAAASAGVSGLVLGALVPAGAALGWLIGRSAPASVASGLLAALYGPTYWLPQVAELTVRGTPPSFAALSQEMPARWTLSPLTPAFPTAFSAQGGSPGLPLAALSWMAVLLVAGCLPAAKGAPPRRRRAFESITVVAVGAGTLAALGFAADFFAPLAALGVLTYWLASRSRASVRVCGSILIAAGALFVALLAVTRQIAAVGAARDVHLALNQAAWSTPSYGGNHALLAGGTAVRLPNWIQVHDWGLLYWPGVVGGLAVGLARRNALLFAMVTTSLLCALFWHAFDIAYETAVPTSPRVQMYRYASMATMSLAPALPAAAGIAMARFPGAARVLTLAALTAVGGGAGVYWTFGALRAAAATPAEWAGDVALARVLADEPRPDKRLVVLNAPTTFTAMYDAAPGGFLPLWWAVGETPVPVGWDFGHPERYQALYQRVALGLDPAAAADLRVTHVALAPAILPAGARDDLDLFLRVCRAVRIAGWGEESAREARVLYRISPDACATESEVRP